MSPRKKRSRRIVNPNAQPGIAQAHLNRSFSVLPYAATDLKNGHILYIYKTSEKSRAETERKLRFHFHLKESDSLTINSKVHATVKTLQKFRRLSNEKEFHTFEMICAETFHLPQSSDDSPTSREQDSGNGNSKDGDSCIGDSGTSNSISPVTTPSEHNIELKDGKDEELHIKPRLRSNTLARQLAEEKAKYLKLRKAHDELLKSKSVKYQKLQRKLKDKEEQLKCLECENLILREEIEYLQATRNNAQHSAYMKCF